MNTKLILTTLLGSTLALTGCDFLDDLGNDSDDDDGHAEDTGGDEDDSGEGDEDEGADADEDEGEDEGEADGASQGDAGDAADESGEGESEGGSADPDDTGAADSVGDGSEGAAECDVEGLQVCVEDNLLAVCIDGEVVGFDCNDVCAEYGGVSAGCAFDEESGADVCWCDDGTGGEGGA